MDCCICSPMASSVFRPPRNSICASCYDGAKSIMGFFDNLDGERRSNNGELAAPSPGANKKGLSDAFRRVEEMKKVEQGLAEKVEFLDSFVVTLREAIHTDILVQPGGGGPPIAAHRALLASRSEVFRTVLGSDECKAPASGAISLPELHHEELRCLLEFLYRGSLPGEEAGRHARQLLLAADKYDIPFLGRFCEGQMLGSLGPENALDVLEVSDACASERLRGCAMRAVVANAEDVLLSRRFEDFALKNAHLCVDITRTLLRERRVQRRGRAEEDD